MSEVSRRNANIYNIKVPIASREQTYLAGSRPLPLPFPLNKNLEKKYAVNLNSFGKQYRTRGQKEKYQTLLIFRLTRI